MKYYEKINVGIGYVMGKYARLCSGNIPLKFYSRGSEVLL